MQTGATIVDLRKVLAERFPQSRLTLAPRQPPESMPTGIAALDALLGGGLPQAGFTELLASGNGSGSTEVIHELLRQVALNRQFLALVDGMGSFDVSAVEPAILSRLLWVRCQQLAEALKAMDLLLRDRNFPILVLDLKLNPIRELRKVTSSIWYRYGRLVEHNQATVLVVTPLPLVSGALCRVAVESALGIDVLGQSRLDLLSRLRFQLLRRGAELGKETAAQAG